MMERQFIGFEMEESQELSRARMLNPKIDLTIAGIARSIYQLPIITFGIKNFGSNKKTN